MYHHAKIKEHSLKLCLKLCLKLWENKKIRDIGLKSKSLYNKITYAYGKEMKT